MKKFLQKSCAWLVMLVAMFAVSMSANAGVVNFTGSTPLNQDNVTVTIGAYPGSYSGGICNLYGYNSGTVTISSAINNITKIEFTAGYFNNSNASADAAASILEWDGTYDAGSTSAANMSFNGTVATWQGTPAKSIKFGASKDIDVLTITVYTEDGGVVTYMEVDHVSPAEGEVTAKDGLQRIDIFMKDNFNNTVTTYWGHAIPDGVVMSDGTNTYPLSTFSAYAGGAQLNISLANKITTPGTYTLTIPEGFNSGSTGISPAMEFTWTILPATTFDIDTYLVSPDRYSTVKSLPSFTVSAPDGVTFDKVQNPTTLKLQGEYDNDTYTDVPATVALVDGKAVFTFTTPYSDKASLNFKVPAGVISDANGLTSEEFSVRFSVDPYEYFTVTPSIESSTTYAETISEIVLTVPEDVTITSVGDEIEVDGNPTLPEVVFSNETHTVTITLDDPFTSGQHRIVIPQGFVKASDLVVSREIELYGVKVLGENDPFSFSELTPNSWTTVTNQSLAEAPIVITFVRELASVDPTKISIQTSDWTTKTVAEFNVEMPEAITLTTDGKVLSVKFSEAFLASDYFASSGYLYIKLYEGALTAKNGSVNDVNEYGIAFNFSVLKSFTMGASEWCTFSSTNYVVVPAGYTVYKVAGFDGDSVVLASVATAGTTLPYYQGFLINGPAGNVYYGTGSQWDAISVSNNYLVGNPEGINTYYASNFISSAGDKWDYQIDAPVVSCKLYQLSYDNYGENLGFYTQTGTDGASIEVPAGKAFLWVPERAAGSIKRFVLQDGTVITGLTAVEVPMEKDAIYNLQGQRVNATAKGGVYVKNGKKFIVK